MIIIIITIIIVIIIIIILLIIVIIILIQRSIQERFLDLLLNKLALRTCCSLYFKLDKTHLLVYETFKACCYNYFLISYKYFLLRVPQFFCFSFQAKYKVLFMNYKLTLYKFISPLNAVSCLIYIKNTMRDNQFYLLNSILCNFDILFTFLMDSQSICEDIQSLTLQKAVIKKVTQH